MSIQKKQYTINSTVVGDVREVQLRSFSHHLAIQRSPQDSIPTSGTLVIEVRAPGGDFEAMPNAEAIDITAAAIPSISLYGVVAAYRFSFYDVAGTVTFVVTDTIEV